MTENNILLGFIPVSERTQDQQDAHLAAVAKFAGPTALAALPTPILAKGDKILLTNSWKHPLVVADTGMVFPRFRQLTGSCVGVGGGAALFTLIAIQRLLGENPTKAFIPFWGFNYGRSRLKAGMRGQGDGSFGSTFAASLIEEGVIAANESGLPQFLNEDGLVLSSRQEMQWSDGASSLVTNYLDEARIHPLGTAAECNGVGDVKAAILNGYPVTFACNNYIGNASVQGSGADACVMGYWNGSGGHQQSVHGVWEHPNFGTLYWVQNSWGGNTYPTDPAGGPICGCWVKEANVTAAFRLDAEVYALSHLNWFPAQPPVVNFDWNDVV